MIDLAPNDIPGLTADSGPEYRARQWVTPDGKHIPLAHFLLDTAAVHSGDAGFPGSY